MGDGNKFRIMYGLVLCCDWIGIGEKRIPQLFFLEIKKPRALFSMSHGAVCRLWVGEANQSAER